MNTSSVDTAAEWLASRPDHQTPKPIVPELRKLFGLTAREACEACRAANDIRRAAHG
jgi:hypothetical protein